MKVPNSRKKEKELFAVAQLQNGFFTQKQAEGVGYLQNNSTYYVKSGAWERVFRGVYRLANYPASETEEYTMWSLWVGIKNGFPVGTYSHITALHYHELSEVIYPMMQITVPMNYRTSRKCPKQLELHKADLSDKEIVHNAGFSVTNIERTFRDIAKSYMMQLDHFANALYIAYSKKLINRRFIYDNEEFIEVLPYITKIIDD